MLATPDEHKITWSELKKLIEEAGVKDNDEIDKIDISWGSLEFFECMKDDDFGWRIIL